METFPRKGIELSDDVSITWTSAVYERPAIRTEFENGWEDVRALRSTGRYRELPVTFKVDEADQSVIADFIEARGMGAEKFILEHPIYGVLIVRLGSDEVEYQTLIHGQVVWFEFDLVFREQH